MGFDSSIFNASVNNIIAAVVVLFILTLYWYLSGPSGRPPGPPGLPILGYLPFLGIQPHETFAKLGSKYGPIFSFYLGNQLVVVLNNYEAIKEAFVKQNDTFSGRPPNMLATVLGNETFTILDIYYSNQINYYESKISGKPRSNLGTYKNQIKNGKLNHIATTDGNIWKIHRRFALTVLRDIGVGKHRIEPLLMDEIQRFLNEIRKFDGHPTDFSELLCLSLLNNVSVLIFGRRFEYDDPWMTSSVRFINEMIKVYQAVTIFQFFPSLNKIPGLAKLLKKGTLEKQYNELKRLIYIKIKEGKLNYTDEQWDTYMNAYIGEQRARRQKNKEDNSFPDEALEQNLRGFMIGGTETTSNTLMWAILCMVLNPEVQRKVQCEIDDVIGTGRTSCWEDRHRTPYVEATINEIQRFLTLAPVSVPHRNIEECEIFGYKIPKNSFILSNIWAVHNDPELWQDPEVFRPERFLTPNGEIKRIDYLIPFSLGARQCLGISLAKMELYLYFTSLLQQFTFRYPVGTTPSLEPRIGITYSPKYFKPIALTR